MLGVVLHTKAYAYTAALLYVFNIENIHDGISPSGKGQGNQIESRGLSFKLTKSYTAAWTMRSCTPD